MSFIRLETVNKHILLNKLQRNSNQDCVIYRPIYRPMKQNRKPRNKPLCTWPILFGKDAKTTQQGKVGLFDNGVRKRAKHKVGH